MTQLGSIVNTSVPLASAYSAGGVSEYTSLNR